MPFITLAENDKALPAEILDQWNTLALTTNQGDPLCCAPAWNLAFHHVTHPARRIFYYSSSNSLLLFCEYQGNGEEVYLVPLEDSWMFGQPLLGFYAPEMLEEAMAIFAREYAPLFPVIVLSGIRRSSPETMKLYVLYSRRFNFYRYRTSVQCSASLQGGLDGWLSRRSANHRAKLKKAARKAAAAGISFEKCVPGDEESAAIAYQRMLAVELRSWKGIGHCGMAEYPSREFYSALMARLSRSASAHIIFARCEGRDIGFIFGSTAGGIYRGQQFSYSAEYGAYSIGNLMQLEKVKWLSQLGIQRYDMGPITGPRMEYKAHWTEQTREIETWVMRAK